MLQRIQSLYLGTTCIVMAAFLRVVVWVKVDSDRVCTMRPYALMTAMEGYIIFPYGLPALLACLLIVMAVYAIVQHDNRKLQLRLIAAMNLVLTILMVLIVTLVNKADAGYLLNGHSSYTIGSIFPFIGLVANLLARRHIKKDEALVHEDRLR